MKRLNIKYILPALGIIVTLASCQDVVKLDIPQDQTSKLVVDGWIYKDSTAKVQLSLSVPYFKDGQTPKVTTALVTVSDGVATDTLTQSIPGSGLYENGKIIGAVGKTYTMKIIYDGKEYISQNTMPRGMPIDTLYGELSPFGRPGADPRYTPTYYIDEPAGTGDNVLIRYYKNDTLSVRNFDLEVEDDFFVDGQRVQAQARDGVPSKTKVRIELHSITRDVYQYYFQVVELLQQQGGLFSPPPAPAKGNVSNGALGIFRASAVTAREAYMP